MFQQNLSHRERESDKETVSKRERKEEKKSVSISYTTALAEGETESGNTGISMATFYWEGVSITGAVAGIAIF